MKGLLMSTSLFISRSACSNRRPSLKLPHHARDRPHLISKLLKERAVARFIIAPFGYGKTCLADEYAETIHYWAHVFWINCQSPCFLRDLDSGIIFESCIAADQELALVVFEDLPELNEERSETFSSLIDSLLDKECEVVTTCIPSHDRFERLQKDRICLNAHDLILSDEEYDMTRSQDEICRIPAHQIISSKRIPCFVWESSSDIGELFMSGIMQENIPSNIFRIMVTMLILQKGDIYSLSSYMSSDIDAFSESFSQYPHFGIDNEGSTFSTLALSLECMRPFFRKHASRLISKEAHGSFELLVSCWAESLVAQDNYERACDLVGLFMSTQFRDEWLFGHTSDLVAHACFFPMMKLLSAKRAGSVRDKSRFEALKALCLRILGCHEEALQNAQLASFNESYPPESNLLGLLTLSRIEDATDSTRISEGILKALDRTKRETSKRVINQADHDLLVQLGHARLALYKGVEAAMKKWSEFYDHGADYRLLCIMGSWILYSLLDEPCMQDNIQKALFEKIEDYVYKINENKFLDNALDFFVLAPLHSLVQLRNKNKTSRDTVVSTDLGVALQKVESSIVEQGRKYRQLLSAHKAIKEDWHQTHYSLLGRTTQYQGIRTPERKIPHLYIKTFGGFEVMMENNLIDYIKFKRHHTRTLLALLSLNHGKEISREIVSEAMWPNSPASIAHKNFYTVWSDLRKVLSLPDGTCPYLVRHQYGCSLNMQYVKTDVEKFDEICRGLIFDIDKFEDWSGLFHKIESMFCADFMPSEQRNMLIVRARNDCRARLVDALVAASEYMTSVDSSQLGVWFARLAVNRDEMREDAYVALMKAQIAVNQRTAAMMTYLHCRKALSENLGIDPSPETTSLYEDLLHYNSVPR